MLLKERVSGKSVEILNLKQLFSLYDNELLGRYRMGEEFDAAESFVKSQLIFTSGEKLPQCWLDPHYRDNELKR